MSRCLSSRRRGYANLCRLLTLAHADDRLEPALPLEELAMRNDGLVCLSGCARHGLAVRDPNAAARLAAAFGRERFFVELQRPYERGDARRNAALRELAETLGVETVATGDVHSHSHRRAVLQDALVAIGHRATLDGSERERRGNRECVLRPPAEMTDRFPDDAAAVARTAELAARLEFDLTQELGYRYPDFADGEETADAQLRRVCERAFAERYAGANGHKRRARERLEEELRLIAYLELSGFFLLHFEVLELAREIALDLRGPSAARNALPPGRGRGSSVGSIVCYLTGLSHVDPVAAGLSLGRFLNRELASVPDIDLDFPRDVRERLIVEVTERYGREHAALVATFSTYHARGAIRDVGKALGLPFAELERLARVTNGDPRLVEEELAALPDSKTKLASRRWRALGWLCKEIAGLPRHLSQHPGGMVISSRPLVELVPVVPAAMEGRQLCQWDKDSCADAGFLKIDLLGLGMLSAIEDCVERIALARGETVDLSRIPLDDQGVYGEIQAADTVGTFQIESRAQMQSLLRTRPENMDDLTVQVALVRPGPIQGGAVHPYIDRRAKRRVDPSFPIEYDHPLLEEALEETFGVVVFQDQVLEVAMALAGFTIGEAEGLRRAMSRKRSLEALEAFRERFVEGAARNGVDAETANRVYDKLAAFSGFGFPKSHAAAFALLAYQSAWLRRYYEVEFLCALLNAQPMGFYPPASLVRDAQRRGVTALPPDVNASDASCSVEDGAVRIGVGYVQGVGEADAEAIAAGRPYDRSPRSRPAGGGRPRRLPGARRGRRVRLLRRAAARAALAARPRAPPAGRGRRRAPARPAAGADGGDAGAARADRLGADARRLPRNGALGRRPSVRAPASPPAEGDRGHGRAAQPRRPLRADGGGDGHRAPAPHDRERHRLHAARGRARPRQPRRAAAGLRAPPGARARRAAALGAEGGWRRWAGTSTSSCRSSRASARSRASWPASPRCARPFPRPTTSATADLRSRRDRRSASLAAATSTSPTASSATGPSTSCTRRARSPTSRSTGSCLSSGATASGWPSSPA